MTTEQSDYIRIKMGEYIATMDWKSITTCKSMYVTLNYEYATQVCIGVTDGIFYLREVNYAPKVLLRVDGNEISWDEVGFVTTQTAMLVRYWEVIKKAINDFYAEEKRISESIENFTA